MKKETFRQEELSTAVRDDSKVIQVKQPRLLWFV